MQPRPMDNATPSLKRPGAHEHVEADGQQRVDQRAPHRRREVHLHPLRAALGQRGAGAEGVFQVQAVVVRAPQVLFQGARAAERSDAGRAAVACGLSCSRKSKRGHCGPSRLREAAEGIDGCAPGASRLICARRAHSHGRRACSLGS
jgi:hypothetical protein